MWEPWDHRAVVPPSHTMWVLPEKTHALGCSATCSWPFQRGDWDYQSDAGSCPAAVLETPIVIIAWNIVWTQELLVQCSAPNCCCPNTHRNHRVTQPHTLLTILGTGSAPASAKEKIFPLPTGRQIPCLAQLTNTGYLSPATWGYTLQGNRDGVTKHPTPGGRQGPVPVCL